MPTVEFGPSFDIVRVAPDGSVVAAGRARAGSTVVLMLAERELARVPADDNGEWVMSLPDIGLQAGTYTLGLRQYTTDQAPVESARNVVIVLPERPAASATGPVVGGPRGGQKLAEHPLVLSVPAGAAGATSVLQAPVGPARAGDLTVVTIDYDDTGRIAASGGAATGAVVRVYVDDAPVGSAVTGADRKWRVLASESIAPGPHRLRVDRLDGNGKVVGRLELPFVRQTPITAGDDPAGGLRVAIVKGDNLWNIAQARYGSGVLYTVIFQANRAQIRDPDLIYPGQIFAVPQR